MGRMKCLVSTDYGGSDSGGGGGGRGGLGGGGVARTNAGGDYACHDSDERRKIRTSNTGVSGHGGRTPHAHNICRNPGVQLLLQIRLEQAGEGPGRMMTLVGGECRFSAAVADGQESSSESMAHKVCGRFRSLGSVG